MGTRKRKSGMTVFERRALLKLHNLTHAQLARETGRSASTIAVIVNLYPRKKSRKIQEHIARRTETPYEAIWGGAASAEAPRKKRHSKDTLTLSRTMEGVNVKKERAN